MFRYGTAVLATGVALVLQLLAWPYVQPIPFLVFFGAVMFSGWLGGWGPGMLSTLLSALLAHYVFVPPFYAFSLSLRDLGSTALFLFAGVFLTFLNTSMRRGQQREFEQQEWLSTTLRSIGDAVIATDAMGRIVFLNPVAEALTQWTSAEARGKALSVVFHILQEKTRQPVESPVTKVLREGGVVGLANSTLLVRKDGSEIAIDDSGAPIRDGQGRLLGIVLVFRDVTTRKRAQAEKREEQALRARMAELRAAVSQGLAEEPSLERMLTRCTDEVCRHLDAAFVRTWLLDESRAELVLRASAGLYTHLDGAHARVPVGQLKIGRIAQEGRPHLTNEVLQDPQVQDKEWARREGLVSFAGYPLSTDGRVIGVIALFARQPLPPVVMETLADVAMALGQGFRRAKAEEARRKAEQALAAQSRTMQAITNNATLGLLMMDARQYCTFMNEAAEKITGFTLAEVRARDCPLHYVVHHTRPDGSHFPMEECPIDRALPQRMQEQGEATFVHKTGAFYPVAFTASPILEDGVPVGTVIELRDISEEKRQEEERLRLLQETQAAVRVRDEFLSVASHELRTPLTSLQLRLASLAATAKSASEGVVPAERVIRSTEVAQRQAKRLGDLVESLLDVSRLSTGKLQLQLTEVDLTAVTCEMVSQLQQQARKSGCEVQLEASRPVVGLWDRLRLEQVVTNLLTNALKYGAGRPIHVRLWEEGGRARLTVKDEGIGIEPQHASRIFGMFERAVSERHYGGLGLGLYITHQIIEALGGTIRVESQPGQGATFSVELPARPSA